MGNRPRARVIVRLRTDCIRYVYGAIAALALWFVLAVLA